eukprot:1403422-Amphidinium_carterae.2
MSLPFLFKPVEFLLTRLVSYIAIEVERTPPEGSNGRLFGQPKRRLEGIQDAQPLRREHPAWSARAKPEWQLVVGNRACKGVCAELGFDAGPFPVECVKLVCCAGS